MLPLCETIASGPTDLSHLEHGIDRNRAARIGAHKADAVRPDHAHAASARDFEDALLFAPAFSAGLRETVAVNGRDRHTFRHALFDRCLHGVRGHHDKRVIDRFRNRSDVRIRFLPEDLVASRVDRNDAAFVAVLAQIALRARSVLRASPEAPISATERGSKSAWNS